MANSFEHISICAVKVLARLAAKQAVEAELRAKGVRVTLVKSIRQMSFWHPILPVPIRT
jgi:hypothetical protein